VIEALARWMAPILSFTGEEIYANIPGPRKDTIFLETAYTGLTTLADDAAMGREFWEQVLHVKQAVNKTLEGARNAGLVKNGLAAEVTLYVNDELNTLLASLGDELRFVMLTSGVTLAPLEAAGEAEETEVSGLKVAVKVSENAKCERCWHHRPEVGTLPEHPTLCSRCVTNLPDGEGETRHFA